MIIKKLKKLLFKIYNKFHKIEIDDKSSKNIDLGASSVKYFIEGQLGSFISSVREIENDVEIVDQENYIKVNNKWYAVGEIKTPVSESVRKCEKEYIDIMVLYSLIKSKTPSGQHCLNMLLPYNQIQDKIKLQDRIQGQYTIQTSTGEEYKYTLYVPNVKIEGQMSYHYAKQLLGIKDNKCTVVVNIGFSTTDIAVFRGQEQDEPATIQTGTNLLMNQYKHKLDCPNTSVLSYCLMNGDKFTKEEEKDNIRSIQPVLRGLINDINAVLRFVPQSSDVVICGGGAITYGDIIAPKLKCKNVQVLRGDKAIYTDLLGLALHCGNSTVQEIKTDECTEYEEAVLDTIQEDVQEKETVQNDLNTIMLKIRERNEHGDSITQLCKEFNVSRSSFYNWKKSLKVH